MNKQTGFTLMEILLTLSILSLISVMAMPLYRIPTMKTQQALAKATLYELAQKLEQHYELEQSYRHFVLMPQQNSQYRFELTQSTDNNFILAAIPLTHLPEDQCGTFLLDQDGNENVSGPGGPDSCW